MKIFGHPVHIILIHFPSTLFTMDLVCSSIIFLPIFLLINASFYAIIGGVLSGWLAVIFGTFDLLTVAEKKPYLMKQALLHGCINSTVVIIYTVLVYAHYKYYPMLEPDKYWI